MTTTYSKAPSFRERIIGASLIIVGRVVKETEISEGQSSDGSKSFIFNVTVDKLLKGKTTLSSINVRILDKKGDNTDTFKRAEWNGRDKVLLFLSPDYGPSLTENSFVLYFNSIYPIVEEDKVKLDENALKDFSSEKIQIQNKMVKLEDIRSIIDDIDKTKARTQAAMTEYEPAELLKMPYPEVTEMPLLIGEGAKPSSPEDRS